MTSIYYAHSCYAAAAHEHEFPKYSTLQTSTSRRSSFGRAFRQLPSVPPILVTSTSESAVCSMSSAAASKRRSLTAVIPEANAHPPSDDDHSRTDSLRSASTVRFGLAKKPFRIQFRPKTSFQLAHPPPINKQKQRLHIRPRLLLQLQQLSETTRPAPALDVLPSTIFAPRLGSRFPRIFKGKDGLGSNDLIVVSSDSYEAPIATDDDKSSSSEDEAWDHREVVATICQLRKGEGRACGKAEICFNHGPPWEATPLLNGSYEFVATNADGTRTTARWVPRRVHRRTSSNPQTTTGTAKEDKRFTFSIVDPSTRRHPIIASMTRSSIEVLDQYPSSPTPEAGSPFSPVSAFSAETSYFDYAELPERALTRTDDHLRTLIVITGIWVVFREGWSKNFAYADAMSAPLTPIAVNAQPAHRAHFSTLDKNENEGSGHSDQEPHRNSFQKCGGRIRRTSAHLLHRSSASSPDKHQHHRNGVSPKRANSTGAAFIERANRRSLSTARRFTQSNAATSSSESEVESTIDPATAKRVRFGVNNEQAPGSSTAEAGQKHDMPPDVGVSNAASAELDQRTNGSGDSGVGLGISGDEPLEPNGFSKKIEPAAKKRWPKLSRILNFISRRSGAKR